MYWLGKVREALEFIEAHLFEDLSPDAVGKAIHYAPSSFSNAFCAITGYTVAEYIRFRRLSCAADRLAAGGHSVTDAAFDCGYETAEAFSRAFKRLFGCTPSSVASSSASTPRFDPVVVDLRVTGGFEMKRNVVPGLRKVDWSDTRRQNEFVHSVVSALGGLGERLDYDTVCAVSGCAFRTSFSMPSSQAWNHGNYHAINTPPIIEHTFRVLGWRISHHVRADFETDRRRVVDSIDRGSPVVTVEGVVNCADACVISGYDDDGRVLLGHSPFAHIPDDHDEAPDETGYFRKTNWHDGFFAGGNLGRILIIEGPCGKPDADTVLLETLRLARRLIGEDNLAPGQHNGLTAHRAFAEALLTYTWDDNFEPYLNVMCNYKQYLDRQYAAKWLRDRGQRALADLYDRITALCVAMGEVIPQDFSAGDMFGDREALRPYCDLLLQVCALEEQALALLP